MHIISTIANPPAVKLNDVVQLNFTTLQKSFREGFKTRSSVKNTIYPTKRYIHFSASYSPQLNFANFSKIFILIPSYLSDFAELHSLHNICRLSSVVCPPLLQGMMWSPSMSSKAYSVLMPFATHKGHLWPCRS